MALFLLVCLIIMYIAVIKRQKQMSKLVYDVILIVASIVSILPVLLLTTKAIKNGHKGNAHKIKVESKSGLTIELDLYKQNDTKKIHQTVEMLLGK